MHNQFKTQKFKHLMLAMGPRDLNSAPYSPVHCSSHSMTSFQSSELTELPVVENSQLFAQRVHSARCAPLVATSPLPSRGSPTLHIGVQNQKWPTSGHGGYITAAVWEVPNASEREDKIRRGPQLAWWLHHPCHPGGPQHSKAGDKN